MMKILKKSMFFHGPSPPCQVMQKKWPCRAPTGTAWAARGSKYMVWTSKYMVWTSKIHGLDLQIHGLGRPEGTLPGPGGGGPAGPRLAGSFRALKTTVWHRLDAALAGSRSHFGALVPCKESDF